MDNKGLHKNAVSRFFVVPVISVFPRNIDSHGFFQEFINVHAKPCVHADTLLLQITLCKIGPSWQMSGDKIVGLAPQGWY